jgi:hypothetical protein
VSSWHGSIRVTTAEEAIARATIVDTALLWAADADLAAALTRYHRYLDRATASLAPEGDPLGVEAVRALVRQPWMTTMQCLQDVEGRTYYCLGGAVSAASENAVQLSECAIRLADLDETAKRTSKLLTLPRAVDRHAALRPAPHVSLAKALEEELAEYDAHRRSWETLHLRLARRIIEATTIDPILRLALASDRLERQNAAGWGGGQELGAFQARLEGATVAGVRASDLEWPSPDNPAVARGRQVASERLSNGPDLVAVERAIEADLKDTQAKIAPLRCVGVVWPGEDGAPTVMGTGTDGALFEAALTAPGKVSIREIGAVAGGRPTFTAPKPPVLGTPVFARSW